MMPKSVDEYLLRGCMRCNKGDTPACKVHAWADELRELRAMALACGLQEEVKWGTPCYVSADGKNVFNLSALKTCCAIGFFKGSLLHDPMGQLSPPGPHSQSVRMLKFSCLADIRANRLQIEGFIQAAIKLEQSGVKVAFQQSHESMPEELREALDANPALKSAFDALTPGRQRGYILHISAPKQSSTRRNRLSKCETLILAGVGLHDHYKARRQPR